VSRLHEHQSYEVADFPVLTGREELVPVLSPVTSTFPPVGLVATGQPELPRCAGPLERATHGSRSETLPFRWARRRRRWSAQIVVRWHAVRNTGISMHELGIEACGQLLGAPLGLA
jgi:hypothetical protein